MVEFGTDPDEPRTGRSRWNVTDITRGLATDRRSVPLAAALAGVALFASLISEWQVTTLVGSQFAGRESGNEPLTVGIADLGALGAGYLVGLFALTGAVVLVLFGPPAGRRYARPLGLGAGGVLLGILAASMSTLSDSTRAVPAIFLLDVDPDQIQLSYGRGVWCGFFGVLFAVLALYLAGRHVPVVAGGEPAAGADAEPDAPVWSWRRPGSAGADEDPRPDAPMDLTVTSTTPFTSLGDDRSRDGRDGGRAG